MKKIFLFSLISLVSVVSFAQVTVSTSDMPNVNDTIRFSETIDIQGVDPALTGTNYLWDFSLLQPISQRIDTFFAVTSTPIAYQFFFNNVFLYAAHKASYATTGQDFNLQVVNFTEVFDFIKNSSSAYSNVGFGSNINGIPSSTRKIPVDVEYSLPLNYGNTNTSNSEFSVGVPTVGTYGQTQERIDTVDGWGSLITPYGTFNCIRVKSVLNKIDTIYTDQFGIGFTIPRPQEIEYKWLANGKGMPLLKVVTNGGAVTEIEYQDSIRDLSVGVNKISFINEVKVFPNPTKDFIVIDLTSKKFGNVSIEMFDVLGKETKEVYANKLLKGNNKMLINLLEKGVKSGVYFVNIIVDGDRVASKKIIVN